MWQQLIKDLGGPGAVSDRLGVSSSAVSNWSTRGVPWRLRPTIAQMAKAKRVSLPDDFWQPAA